MQEAYNHSTKKKSMRNSKANFELWKVW